MHAQVSQLFSLNARGAVGDRLDEAKNLRLPMPAFSGHSYSSWLTWHGACKATLASGQESSRH
eukprot:4623306-Amphidinium_carterae.1